MENKGPGRDDRCDLVRRFSISSLVVIAAMVVAASMGGVSTSTTSTSPIVAHDPTHVTHKLDVGGGVQFGFSQYSGGYGNGFWAWGSGNIAAPPNGRGWQSSLRDSLHSGRHNPTQAGFAKGGGAPTTMGTEASSFGTGKRLTVRKFPVLLWNQESIDFTERENLYPDIFSGDGRNSDADALANEQSQAAEITSEFDFRGWYENATPLAGGNVKATRHVFFYSMERKPASIRQFANLIEESCRVRDAHETLPGNQVPRNDDYSVLDQAWGIRVITRGSGLKHMMWYDSKAGQFRVHDITNVSIDDHTEPHVRLFEDAERIAASEVPESCIGGKFDRETYSGRDTDRSMLLLSRGTNPQTAQAVALFYPRNSRINQKSVVGRTAEGEIVYREDRRMRMKGIAGRRGIADWATSEGGRYWDDEFHVRYHLYNTGMLSPSNPQLGQPINGKVAKYEEIGMELFVLVGTPNQILAAADRIEAKAGSLTYAKGDL
jgi:hypothetical protein